MKKKSLFLTALALSVTTPAFVQTAEIHAETTSFKDIPSSHAHKAKIDKLVEMGVISGFTDNTFRPFEKVTRGQFALFISKALMLPAPTSPKSFSDVGKSSAVYDGVVKAQEAGIISGYSDGRFKPTDIISRGDMAIMLDRALQYKSTFGTKAPLTYTDKNSIGASAVAPIQRLTNYKIMGAYSGTSFSPNTHGDRISTVVSIYQLMVTKSLIAGEVVEENKPKDSLKNYSYVELVDILGEWKILKRAGTDGSIHTIDAVAEMKSDVSNLPNNAPALKLSPKEFFESYIGALKSAPTLYGQGYPLSEYVTINGVPFRETVYYPEFWKNPDPMYLEDIMLNNVIPNPPKENGKFSIDIPAKNRDLVTYHNGKVDTERMASLVEKTANGDYLVDIKALFKDTSIVTVSADGLTIKNNNKELKIIVGTDKASLDGKSISLSSAVVSRNGVVLVPFKAMADNLGLYWRQMDFAKRFELANYPLEKGVLGWEE